jgi:uncharacterized protein YpmB
MIIIRCGIIMDRKKLVVAGGLMGLILCLFSVFMIMSCFNLLDIIDPFQKYNGDNISFNNSTPESTAVSIARLNFGSSFNDVTVEDVYLTDDGKYWIVGIDPNDSVHYVEVTIDAKTLMSKRNDEGTWRSLDELKANYIAEIQTDGIYGIIGSLSKPQEITMGGKEIWKISMNATDESGEDTVKYVYVDLATGKSKNTLDYFNNAAGTDGWLTLKEVDDVINKGDWDYPEPRPFRDALRDLYSE